MRNKFLLMVGLFFLVTGTAFAHGDKKHVVGTIEKVNAESVVVKTADGKEVEVKLIGSTVFIAKTGAQEKPARAADLAVGDRVVIHATPKGETLEANEVKFSKQAGAAATVKPAH
jgi:hypothetical protein